jgi:hypothetical protein
LPGWIDTTRAASAGVGARAAADPIERQRRQRDAVRIVRVDDVEPAA